MSLQALRDKRAAKATELRDLANKEDYSPERDNSTYDTLLGEIDTLDDQITRIEKANNKLVVETVAANVIETADKNAQDKRADKLDPATQVFTNWVRKGIEGMNAEERAAFLNTMSTTTNSEGGYTVAQEWATSVLDALKAYGGMRAIATILRTSGVGQLNYPTSDGTSEEGEIVAENAAAAAADVSFGTKALVGYKYSSKIVAVPFELLQDSNVDVEAFIRARLVTRLGRITNKHFTAGTGVSQPTGVITAAAVGVTAAATHVDDLTYENLVDLEHSIDPAYREVGSPRWMFNDTTLKYLRKIKDSNNRPIFVPGYEQGVPGGAPSTLLGRGLVINQHMDDLGADNLPVAFGDFSYYVIRDIMAMEMFRFADSPYISKGQIGFLAWMRTGGNLIDVGGAVKTFQNAAA
jgi:HK97 family phage major capsid protein